MTSSKVALPPLSTRLPSWSGRGPSMEMPMRYPCSARNAAHSASMRVPLVWIVFSKVIPGRRYRSCNSATRRKKSRPMSVGSPPCQANVTRSVRCASISPRTYASSVASSIRNDEPGCIASLSRKKQ